MIRTFGPKKNEVTGTFRKQRNEEFHNVALQNMLLWADINETEADQAFNTYGEDRKLMNTLAGKCERKKPLRGCRYRRDINIEKGHEDTGYDGVDRIHKTHKGVNWWAVVEAITFWVRNFLH
jgi:hypothetical protein